MEFGIKVHLEITYPLVTRLGPLTMAMMMSRVRTILSNDCAAMALAPPQYQSQWVPLLT